MPGNTIEVARSELLQIKHLPPLSVTADRLFGAIADSDIEIDELADIITHDPALTARVIGLANSAYFGQTRPVNSVEDAIIRVLGLNMVKSLALSIAVAGSFDTGRCAGFDLSGYWFGALASAQLARMLAMKISGKDGALPDSVYLGGLFHNLGVLLLAHVYPEQYSKALADQLQDPSADLLTLERDRVGIDSCNAGVWLARRWHLSGAVVDMMEQQGHRSDQDMPACLVGSAVNWVAHYQKGDEFSLKDDLSLHSLPGMGRDVIVEIEEKFGGQCSDLNDLAQMLA